MDRERWEQGGEIKRKSRRWTRLSYEATTTYDTTVAGPKVKASTLLIYGEPDRLSRWAEKAREGIRGSSLAIVSAAPPPPPPPGGIAHEHKPQEFTKVALDFLLSQ